MQTNKTISQESELAIKGLALLTAAHEYWEVYQRELEPSAVVWLENDNGHFVLFTRSEFRDELMSVVPHITGPVLFDPFVYEQTN